MMPEWINKLRYVFRIWSNVPGMTLAEAWQHPYEPEKFGGDPIAAADCQIANMLDWD